MGRETLLDIADKEAEKDHLQKALNAEHNKLLKTLEEEVGPTSNAHGAAKTVSGRTEPELVDGKYYSISGTFVKRSDSTIAYYNSNPLKIEERISGGDSDQPTWQTVMSFELEGTKVFIVDAKGQRIVRGPNKKRNPDASKFGFRRGVKQVLELSGTLRENLRLSRPGRLANR